MKRIRKNTEIRTLIVVAKVVSTLFRPVYYPVLCCAILFTLTPLSLLPLEYKLLEVGIMVVFTILLPWMLIVLYRKIRGLSKMAMWQNRLQRIAPYLIHIGCYMAYLHLMQRANIPYILLSVIIVSLFIQIACTLISFGWKVSVHMAGAGAIIGAIGAYSLLFNFNPLLWFCIAIMVAGLVGTSRMILRQHSLWQVIVGTIIGVQCGYFGILYGDLLVLLY